MANVATALGSTLAAVDSVESEGYRYTENLTSVSLNRSVSVVDFAFSTCIFIKISA